MKMALCHGKFKADGNMELAMVIFFAYIPKYQCMTSQWLISGKKQAKIEYFAIKVTKRSKFYWPLRL